MFSTLVESYQCYKVSQKRFVVKIIHLIVISGHIRRTLLFLCFVHLAMVSPSLFIWSGVCYRLRNVALCSGVFISYGINMLIAISKLLLFLFLITELWTVASYC